MNNISGKLSQKTYIKIDTRRDNKKCHENQARFENKKMFQEWKRQDFWKTKAQDREIYLKRQSRNVTVRREAWNGIISPESHKKEPSWWIWTD